MLKPLFHQTQRMTGRGSNITVIEPSKYLAFFQSVSDHPQMSKEFKAFLAIAVSGGCRVSEALSVTIGSVKSDGFFRVRVLKKVHKRKDTADLKAKRIRVLPKLDIFRSCLLSPIANKLVREHIDGLPRKDAFSPLFKMHRATVHRKIKKYFGPDACSHSIARHSHISWLLHEKEIPIEKVASEMKMHTHIVDYYNHANIEVEQRNRFAIGE